MDIQVASMTELLNGAAMIIGVHVTLSVLVSSGCMPVSGVAGFYGSSRGFPVAQRVKNLP